VLPSIDAALGIDHDSSILIEKLRDMHTYMPESHRSAVSAFRSGPDVRPYVADQNDPELEGAFNRCARGLSEFRRVHLGQVVQYIRRVTNETEGTGGTEYMPFLEKLRAETEERLF
jgi:indoleamine 2,3-dioxygenase